MTDLATQQRGAIRPAVLWALVLLAGGMSFALATGFSAVTIVAAAAVVTEAGAAAAVLLAAGGCGYPIIRRLAPSDCPWPLKAVTACALGLWMLGTSVLVVGSFTHGLLTPAVWWPVVGAGVTAAIWQCRHAAKGFTFPSRFTGQSRTLTMCGIAAAVAAGLWLGGAARPGGFFHSSDAYDVLEYHLQLPREFHHAQHVGQLQHNCYSYYPLGVEMLFLLAMCLRGGAYEGMYLAKLIPGLFGMLAVAGIWAGLEDQKNRGRFSAVLLAGAPFVAYLSWLAMVELAQVCYLALALIWLRRWVNRPGAGSACCVGLMAGAACAAKYLSVGLVAGPVFVVMLALSLRSGRRMREVLLAGLAAIAMFSPYLVRNSIYTGNPVFPLATGIFGRGHWQEESARRWDAGHSATPRPPVPQPPAWHMPPSPGRAEMFGRNFLAEPLFGPMLIVLAAASIGMLTAAWRRSPPWEWALVGVLAVQLAVWAVFTRGMPARFIAVALVPMALLGGRVPAELLRRARASANDLRRRLMYSLAAVIFLAAVGMNLAGGLAALADATAGQAVPPLHGKDISAGVFPYIHAAELPAGSRILLVGDAKAFYFPPQTIYATAFDAHPLDGLIRRGLPPAQIAEALMNRGITHIWVDWGEVARLAKTYGYPASLSGDLLRRLDAREPIGLDILDRMAAQGLAVARHIEPPSGRGGWPVTIYRLVPPNVATRPLR